MPQNPFGLHTVTPYLVVKDAQRVVSFLQEVFDGKLRGDLTAREDGSIRHGEVVIGDSVVMLGESMDGFEPMPSMLHIYVDDCEATYAKALTAGATAVEGLTMRPHGDRSGGVRGPAGNIWWIVTHVGR